MLRVPAAALTALHRALAQDRSPAEAAGLARQLGYELGESYYQAFQQWLGDQGVDTAPDQLAADDFWRHLGGFFASLGWGELRFDRLAPGVASLSSGEWPEAAPGAGARQPTCHLSTGLLADLLGRVAGDDLAVMEVECRSRGDGTCRFVLGGSAALEQLYQSLRSGSSYQDAVAELA